MRLFVKFSLEELDLKLSLGHGSQYEMNEWMKIFNLQTYKLATMK